MANDPFAKAAVDREQGEQHRRHALVCDDDPLMLDVIAKVLAKMGYGVSTATNGHEALEVLRRGGLDLVVTGVKMPGLDGLDVLRAIKDTDPDLPVVLISGYTEMNSVLEAINIGAQNFLLKPVGLEDFKRVVGRIETMAAMQPSQGKAGLCGRQLLSYSAQSRPEHARQLVYQIGCSAAGIGFCKDDLPGSLKLALTEALINAMEHGNAWDVDKLVLVECELTPTSLRVTVEDQGAGWDFDHPPDPTLPDNLLHERGRGIFLMHAAMDEVRYHPPGNRVTLIKNNG